MVRFVAGPDRNVVPDLERKLPGRGAWITARRALVIQAVKRGILARGIAKDVMVRSDLADRLDFLMERWVLDALGRACKAGLAIPEFNRIINALSEGSGRWHASAVLCAREADGAATAQIVSALRECKGEGVEIVNYFTRTQLDLAFRRLNVVHAALIAGRASETFLARWRIFKSFRADEPDL